MRLIDANEALDAIDNRIRQIGYEDFVLVLSIRQAVRDVKPVDAVPVRHGRWRHYEGMLTCSECGMEFYDDIMEHCGDHVPKFCPECGADMRKDSDGK